MKSINHENIEEWMFDYTEGNLTPEDQKKLISFIEYHPSYKEDLNLWSMAYIKAPLPKAPLKPSLKRFFPRKYLIYLLSGSVICAILIAMFYHSPKSEPMKNLVNEKTKIQQLQPSVQPATPENSPSVEAVPGPANQNIVSKKTELPASPSEIQPVPSVASVPNLISDTLQDRITSQSDSILVNRKDSIVGEQPLPMVSEAPTKPRHVPIEAAKKTLTNKEVRQIQKLKAKTLQRRREAELMKGNKPYVVPFNDGF